MEHQGGTYRCPNSPGQCSTPPVNADTLLRAAVTQMITDMTQEPYGSHIVGLVQEQTEQHTQEAARKLRQSQDAREELAAINEGLRRLHARPDGSDQLNNINRRASALTQDIQESRHVLDGHDFVTDEDRIRENMYDPETYLAPHAAEYMAQVLETMVESVVVAQDHAVLVYLKPAPPEGTRSRRLKLS